MTEQPNSFRNQPDERGHFGQFGGRYVAETLMPLILDLEREYRAAKADPAFKAEFEDLLEHYVGRPSPLYFAPRLTEALGGAQIWFKRDELNHTGAHKINNCIGQILLAMRMGKTRIIAETGAGQQRPVESQPLAAGQFLRGGIVQDHVRGVLVALRALEAGAVLHADRLPDLERGVLAQQREPLGRLGAVELDHVGAHRLDRLGGRLRLLVDQQEHDLGSPRHPRAQRGALLERHVARARRVVHEADVRRARGHRGIDGFGRAEAADLDLGFGHAAHLVRIAVESRGRRAPIPPPTGKGDRAKHGGGAPSRASSL